MAAADKLYNARSIINDMRLVGEEVWNRFSVPRDKTLWYYQEVTEALAQPPPAPRGWCGSSRHRRRHGAGGPAAR